MDDIKTILRTASARNASDIHVTVGTPPRIRANGVLETMDAGSPSQQDMEAMLEELSTETIREKFAKRGDYEFSYSDPSLGRFRVNAYRQRGSVSLAIRLVGASIPSKDDIRLPGQLMDIASKSAGLVIAAGTAGSGKSTSLAVIIDAINHTRDLHVITLEEPIEFLHRHDRSVVDQREIGVDGRDYEEGIRSAIRSDPDVIMIEDLTDAPVIRMAAEAAESGKLVLSTVSATGAAAAVEKLVDAFPPREQSPMRAQLARTLHTVFAQQLVATPSGERIAAFEIMNAKFHEIRSCIREGELKQLPGIIKDNPKANMLAMDDDLLALMAENKITKTEALRFARDASYIAGRS